MQKQKSIRHRALAVIEFKIPPHKHNEAGIIIIGSVVKSNGKDKCEKEIVLSNDLYLDVIIETKKHDPDSTYIITSELYIPYSQIKNMEYVSINNGDLYINKNEELLLLKKI